MKLADKVQAWLCDQEWDDKVTLDEENQESSVSLFFTIKNQAFKVWLETDEKRDMLKIYLYAPFYALSTKLTDCAILFNHINTCSNWGSITCKDEKGAIRWRHSIDFEGTDPSIATIDNAFNVGANLFEHWFEEITSVALTQTTAKEIITQCNATSEPEDIEEFDVNKTPKGCQLASKTVH